MTKLYPIRSLGRSAESLPELLDQGPILVFKNGSGVDHEPPIHDPADHGRIPSSQGCRQFFGLSDERQSNRGHLPCRECTTADFRRDRQRIGFNASARELPPPRIDALRQRLGRPAEGIENRHFLASVSTYVRRKRCFECHERKSAEPQRPGQGVLAGLSHEVGAPHDRASLRSPQGLVGRKAHDVSTAFDRLGDRRLPGDAYLGQVEQGAAAEVFDERNAGFLRQNGKVWERGRSTNPT